MARASRRRGRWLVAGGLVGLILTRPVTRASDGIRSQIRRLLSIADPVAPFRQAPCERRHAANGNTVGVEEAPEG